MFNQLTTDLRSEALWRAGEPQDSTSSFWLKSLDYLNRIQQTLVLGGGVAVGRDLATSAGIYAHVVQPAITDWFWARKLGVITTIAVIQTGTVTLVQNSDIVTFSVAPTQDIINWRLLVNYPPAPPSTTTIPRIQEHTPGLTTARMDAVWPEISQTAVGYTLFKLEYALPDDFLRLSTPLASHSGWWNSISVSTKEQLDNTWPYGIGLIRQGGPRHAYMLAGGTLGLSTWDTRGYRLEFEYIALPASLIDGNAPVLPAHYRPVLSVGAAMLMCFDKGDARAQNLASEYREMVSAMGQEHRRAMSGGSSFFGQIKPRQGWGDRLRGPQPMGELFLV